MLPLSNSGQDEAHEVRGGGRDRAAGDLGRERVRGAAGHGGEGRARRDLGVRVAEARHEGCGEPADRGVPPDADRAMEAPRSALGPIPRAVVRVAGRLACGAGVLGGRHRSVRRVVREPAGAVASHRVRVRHGGSFPRRGDLAGPRDVGVEGRGRASGGGTARIDLAGRRRVDPGGGRTSPGAPRPKGRAVRPRLERVAARPELGAAGAARRRADPGAGAVTGAVIDRAHARRIAVAAQLLDGSATDLDAAIRRLNCLQIDPTNVVARNQYLVPWSRLGAYDRALLDDACWGRRWLFGDWAHAASLVLTEDFLLHRALMRAYKKGGRFLSTTRAWVADNRKLRDHVLREARRGGPVPTNQFTDLSQRSYRSGGWNDERNVGRMLDAPWTEGRIMVSYRDGLRRFWDLSERVLPEWTPREPMSETAVWRRRSDLALRALGIGTAKHVQNHFMRW